MPQPPCCCTMVFLSTPSARRATRDLRGVADLQQISIHALREEGDMGRIVLEFRDSYFYPRPPRGGRPAAVTAVGSMLVISIHALREEGDTRRTLRQAQD